MNTAAFNNSKILYTQIAALAGAVEHFKTTQRVIGDLQFSIVKRVVSSGTLEGQQGTKSPVFVTSYEVSNPEIGSFVVSDEGTSAGNRYRSYVNAQYCQDDVRNHILHLLN